MNSFPRMSPRCWENPDFGSQYVRRIRTHTRSTLTWFQQESADDVISASASSHGARAHLPHLQTSEEQKAIILSVTGEGRGRGGDNSY